MADGNRTEVKSQRLSTSWDWKSYFSRVTLSQGRSDELSSALATFEYDKNRRWARAKTKSGFIVEVDEIPASYSECVSFEPWKAPKSLWSYRPAGVRDKRHTCTCPEGKAGGFCRHQANLLYHWEKVLGPFVFTESDEECETRLMMEEWARQERIRAQKEAIEYPVAAHLSERMKQPRDVLRFQPWAIFSEPQSNVYEKEIAQALLEEGARPQLNANVQFDRNGEQLLQVEARWPEDTVRMTMSRDRITGLTCTCGRCVIRRSYYFSDDMRTVSFCGHALAASGFIWDYIVRQDPGDETDQKASKLLGLAAEQDITSVDQDTADSRRSAVRLTPRITVDKNSGRPQLSFAIGRTGGKNYVLRSFDKLVEAYSGRKEYALSSSANLNFGVETFTPESQRWYGFIDSRVQEVAQINKRLSRGYYYSTVSLSVGSAVPLEGSELDLVYDLTEGGSIAYQYGQGKTSETFISVGPAKATARVEMDPVTDDRGRFLGIDVRGTMPIMLQGNQYRYILDKKQLGRVSEKELAALLPFRDIAGPDGAFSCRIGRKKLAEFYYRVLPQWQSTDQIILDDRVGELPEGLLPAEPDFAFYIDMDRDLISCSSYAVYGDLNIPIGDIAQDAVSRDADQEARVLGTVEQYFPAASGDPAKRCLQNTDENLMRVLSEAVPALSRFGAVNGSDAFKRVKVYTPPQTRISVEIEGGLLDLSVQTDDMSRDELLDLLQSYRKKKRWHRLKSGDFVDLEDADGLAELDKMADDLGLSLASLVDGQVQLPKYRALYVDRLLEGHDELAADRDSNFKALVRSFSTIKDSDYEVPAHLAGEMRPYQNYGFRWLSTVAQNGFGGILADEMGLGKTLQMLSLLEAMKNSGEKRPSLVVCPASLVYNWKEEVQRFTPSLSVELLAGTLPQRKPVLKSIASEDHADLYISSYDTLKRDISWYENIGFASVVLDEAQFIKNSTTAAAKAVKVLRAEHRFALTGTPIENRLSELWSIFDFLMPGFLYTAADFTERFETPIMKRKDKDATDKLARMVEPFILRRKKQDVLKDLPEKLEEVQSQAMEEDQRRLYDAQLVHAKEMLENGGDSGEDRIRILAEITRLRQLCCDPSLVFEDYRGSSAKRSACLDLIERAIDGGHRMLVFSQFTSMLDLLASDLRAAGIEFYTITGATQKQERMRLVNEFNSGNVPVFLISLRAGGTGLNLTGADVVIHYDPWWNLAVQNQATDRAHRIGQTRKVTVIKLIAAETIEDKIIQLQNTKQDLADAIVGSSGSTLLSLTREELLSLLS